MSKLLWKLLASVRTSDKKIEKFEVLGHEPVKCVQRVLNEYKISDILEIHLYRNK